MHLIIRERHSLHEISSKRLNENINQNLNVSPLVGPVRIGFDLYWNLRVDERTVIDEMLCFEKVEVVVDDHPHAIV